MRSDIVDHDGYRIVSVGEETIDFANVSDFRDVLDENVKDYTGNVILDLSVVTYIGSVGLGLISLVSVMLDSEGRRFIVVCATDEVRRLFHISGLDRVMTVVETVESAQRRLS